MILCCRLNQLHLTLLTRVWWAELGWPHPQVYVLWNPKQELPENVGSMKAVYICLRSEFYSSNKLTSFAQMTSGFTMILR